MKVVMLGCGSSIGAPAIGCDCKVCKSENPKNKRTRASIYLEHEGTSILVDTSPDLRAQAINCGITKIDGVFYTHSHADHINGIDDIKSFNFLQEAAIPAFGDAFTMDYLQKAFPFVFWDNVPGKGWYKPWLKPNYIEFDQSFKFGNIDIDTFEMVHGKLSVVGYKFGDVAYTTDTTEISDHGFEVIKKAKLWIVDCLRYDPSDTHANFELTMKWIDQVKPQKAILTHMAHDFDYEQLKKELPENIIPAYDGMIINV